MTIYRSFTSSLLANISNEMTTLRSEHVYSADNLSSHLLINIIYIYKCVFFNNNSTEHDSLFHWEMSDEFMLMTRALWVSLLWITVLSCPHNHVIISPHFCPLLCWEVASQQPHSQSWWCCLSNPPGTLLVPPTLSFSQFPAAPLGSWVLSEKLFLTEPPQVPANGSLGSRCPRDGARPMADTHNCTLPEGKVHSESMNVSIFNLSGRKWDAKQHFLQQCLNITQATRATQCGAQTNTLAWTIHTFKESYTHQKSS